MENAPQTGSPHHSFSGEWPSYEPTAEGLAIPPAIPRHGDQGDRGQPQVAPAVPQALSLALTRESGARGSTIARRVGERLGWQVYDQELLEYMTQAPVVRGSLLDSLPDACRDWLQQRLAELERTTLRPLQEEDFRGENAVVRDLVRVILALGAQGKVVLIGRGAGCVLPRWSTVNVRIVAPLEDRIAYLSQQDRLSASEAIEKVRANDQRRRHFVSHHFGRSLDEVHNYDLVLNSSLLGAEGCVELIVRAIELRSASREQASFSPRVTRATHET
jgi:cytidylate kinase